MAYEWIYIFPVIFTIYIIYGVFSSWKKLPEYWYANLFYYTSVLTTSIIIIILSCLFSTYVVTSSKLL